MRKRGKMRESERNRKRGREEENKKRERGLEKLCEMERES